MLNNIKNELLAQTDSLLEYLDSLNLEPSTPFTEAEVQSIIAAETAQTQANYDRAVSQFQESNADAPLCRVLGLPRRRQIIYGAKAYRPFRPRRRLPAI